MYMYMYMYMHMYGLMHVFALLLQCCRLLDCMGVPYLQSRGEAEALCSLLNSTGVGRDRSSNCVCGASNLHS